MRCESLTIIIVTPDQKFHILATELVASITGDCDEQFQ